MIFSLILTLLATPFAQPAAMDIRQQEDLVQRALRLVDSDQVLEHFGTRSFIRDDPLVGGGVHSPVKCGTLLTSEIASNWARLSKTTQASLSSLFQRQARQASFISRNDRFEVHYDTTGSHAVAHFDDDGNGTPDYVDFVANTFEDVWDLQILQLGYLEPPVDSDGRYDVYIKNLGNSGVYGLTWPDPGGTTTASYMEIDNNFTDNIYFTREHKAVQVTAAHEFYHAIQFAYYAPFDVAWWQELTATWMEDFAYDDVNDYYAYVEFFLEAPEESLDKFSFGNLRPFGASIFGHYLADVYGTETIKSTWDSLGTRTPSSYDIVDIDSALPGGFSEVLPRFAIWNYFTGTRQRGYYQEGGVFEEVSVRTIQPSPGQSTADFKRVDHFGATYIRVETQGLSGGLRVTLDLDSDATWGVVVLLVTANTVDILRPSGSDVEIPNVGSYDEVVIIPMVLSSSGTNFTVDYSVLATTAVQGWSDLIGDFDHDGEVGFNDFLGFADSFGRSGAEGHDERHDMDANGTIDFSDFLKFAGRFGDKL